MLLPGTPFPACGLPEEATAGAEKAVTQQDSAPAKTADTAEAKSD